MVTLHRIKYIGKWASQWVNTDKTKYGNVLIFKLCKLLLCCDKFALYIALKMLQIALTKYSANIDISQTLYNIKS